MQSRSPYTKEGDVGSRVFVRGAILRKFTQDEMTNMLKSCSVVKIKDVLKSSKAQEFCFVNFNSNAQASDFYHTYYGQSWALCRQLPGIIIREGCNKGRTKIALYDVMDHQPRMSSPDTWCKCPHIQTDVQFREASDVEVSNPEAENAEEKKMAEEIQASLKKKIDEVEKELVLLKKNLKIVEAHLAQL